MTETQWEFECPTFLDFNDPTIFSTDEKENDAYFDAVEDQHNSIQEIKENVKENIEKKKVINSIKKIKRRSLSVTIPISPKFESAARARKSRVLGTVENNLNVKSSFKATPLNKNIFKAGYMCDLPKTKSVKVCQKELSFLNLSKAVSTSDLPNLNVDTNKDDKGLFVTPLPPPQPSLPKQTNEEIKSVANKTNKITKTASAQDNTTVKRSVSVKPFSFVNKDIEKWTHREELWKAQLTKPEKKFEFKAQPMPIGGPRGIPEKSIKPLTKVKPFHLDLDDRVKSRMHSKCPSSSNENVKTVFNFHARPCKVTHVQPFKPIKVHHSPIKCMEFRLHTEIRAREREVLCKQKRELEQKIAEENEKRRIEKENADRENLKAFRASLVHKPREFKKTKPFAVKYQKGHSDQK